MNRRDFLRNTLAAAFIGTALAFPVPKLALAPLPVRRTVITVSTDPDIPADFDNLKDAMDYAEPGGTIEILCVAPITDLTPEGGLLINKSLTIQGQHCTTGNWVTAEWDSEVV